MTLVQVQATHVARWLRWPGSLTWLMMAVAVLAFVARLWAVLRGAGLDGVMGYDDGVYYTGGASLVFGRMPYRDFVFLHPPAILLVLAPFATIGRLLGDPTGFALARLFFMLLGALNAALLTRIAGRLGLVAAAVAGLSYAVWYPSMYASRTTLLEPLGTTGLLVALLILFSVRRTSVRRTSVRGELLAGAALGLGAAVKIWGVLPLVVVVLWQLHISGWRASARVAIGAAVAVVGVCLPFFLLAPGPMTRMVVLAQVGRPIGDRGPLTRLAGISSLDVQLAGSGQATIKVAVVAATALVLVASVYAWRQASSRILVALLVTTGLLLMVSPSYIRHYGEFVAAPLALTVAVAAQGLVDWGRRHHRLIQATAITAVVAPLAVMVIAASTTVFGRGTSWPDRAKARSIQGCVFTDVPTGLIELDVLSSDLRRSCPVWVDVTGLTYLRDVKRKPDGTQVRRIDDPVWQQDFLRYLTSGSATVLLNRPAGGLTPASLTTLNELTLIAKTRTYRIYGAQARHQVSGLHARVEHGELKPGGPNGLNGVRQSHGKVDKPAGWWAQSAGSDDLTNRNQTKDRASFCQPQAGEIRERCGQ